MYKEHYSRPTPSSLPLSYSMYPHSQRRDYLSSSSYRGGDNVYAGRMPTGIRSHLMQKSIQIPPSSLMSQSMDMRPSFPNTSLNNDYSSSMRYTEPNAREAEPQAKMDDLMEYMNYLMTQLENAIQLNQELTSSYEAIERHSKEISEENVHLKSILNSIKYQQPTPSQLKEEEKKNEDLAILQIRESTIDNLSKQLIELTKQKETMTSTLINYKQQIDAIQENINLEQKDGLELAETKALIDKLKQETIRISNENKAKDSQILQCKASTKNFFDQMDKIKKEIEGFSIKMASLSEINNQRDATIKELREKGDGLKRESQGAVKRASNEEYKERYEEEAKRSEKLEKDLGELTNIHVRLVESRDKMKATYVEIIKKIQKTVDETVGKYENIEDIIKENEAYLKQNEFLQSKLKSLPDIDDTLKEMKIENEKLKQLLNPGDRSNDQQENEEDNGEEEVEEQEDGIEKKEEAKTQAIESQTHSQHSFSLYNICLNKLIAYDFNKHGFKAVMPQYFDIFLKDYEPEGSVLYNTLEGLFVLTGKECNQLFYYSQKKNTISQIMKFKENHSSGSMLMDDTSKSLLIISGKHTSKVEQFCFDTVKHSYLPPMLQARANASFCFIGHKLYGFFGYNYEANKALDTIECLNLDACSTWEYINYSSKNSRGFAISHHLVVNVNNNDVLILGGLKGEAEEANDKVISMDMTALTIEECKSDLPLIEETKFYMFENNSQSNILFQNNAMWMVGIDSMNNVHMLNPELNYKVIVFSTNANSKQ